MPANIERDLYSISEAAIRMHMDLNELRDMIIDRKIKIVPRGKRLLVPKTEIQNWIESEACYYNPDADMVPLKRRTREFKKVG